MKILSWFILLLALNAQSGAPDSGYFLRLGAPEDNDSLRLSFSPGQNVPPLDQSGEVWTPDARVGDCYGHYEIFSRDGWVDLDIKFHSGWSSGACSNESLTIKMTIENFDKMFAKETVPVTYYSNRNVYTWPGSRPINRFPIESTLTLI